MVAADERDSNANLLENWSKTSHRYPYGVFRGTFLSKAAGLPCFGFSRNAQVVDFVTEKTREAENTVRDEMNIPRIGEGWVSETDLYYELKHSLPDLHVIHHGRPDWLAKQHLDILIPALNLAIEFQGLQHDEAVEYFGGKDSFDETQNRDRKKRRLCARNAIRLLYVRPGYHLDTLLHEIRAPRQTSR